MMTEIPLDVRMHLFGNPEEAKFIYTLRMSDELLKDKPAGIRVPMHRLRRLRGQVSPAYPGPGLPCQRGRRDGKARVAGAVATGKQFFKIEAK